MPESMLDTWDTNINYTGFLFSPQVAQSFGEVRNLLAKFLTLIFPEVLFNFEICYLLFAQVIAVWWRTFCKTPKNYSFHGHCDYKVVVPFIGHIYR